MNRLQTIGFWMWVGPAISVAAFVYVLAWIDAARCARSGDYTGVITVGVVSWLFVGLAFIMSGGGRGK